MTKKQAAVTALLAAAATGAGTIGPRALEQILRDTCRMPAARIALPDGERITLSRAVNIIGQQCNDNASSLVDHIELTLTKGGATR